MNINLNDQKILKIFYQLNDEDILEINYKDGEISDVNVSKLFEITNVDYKNLKEKDDIRKMISIARNPKFFKKVEELMKNDKVKYCDYTDNNTNCNKQTNTNAENVKISSTTLYDKLPKAKNIIEKDINGELDELLKTMAKEDNKYHISDTIKSICKDDNENSMDAEICYKSLKKIKEKILYLLSIDEIKQDNNDFWELVEEYKHYNNKLKEIKNKEWENITT